ncbi:MAG: DUF1566 domain-containing protein [Candidatus Competibacteraceae bacterium]
MNTRPRFITALVAAGALFIGSSTVAQQRPTLQSLQDQVNNTYTKQQVDDIVAKIVPAAVPRTGQTLCYDASGNQINCPGTGQDGDKLAGVAPPVPRFVDNGNGTVTDKLTGLIWLKNANCFGQRNWRTALNDANTLKGDNTQCGLTDGSTAGQWRLPNVKELQSLINFGFSNPALSNAVGDAKWTQGNAFSGVQSSNYWSSSSLVGNPDYAWLVSLFTGSVGGSGKSNTDYVWPVRGGQ